VFYQLLLTNTEKKIMANWKIDPDHSVAAFKVRHMTITHVRGQFNKLNGTAQFDPADHTSFSLDITIDATGIYTGIRKRDDHLSSPEFLDVAKYPAITFKSTAFTPSGDGGSLTGDLTIHGVTKSATIEVAFSGPVISPEDLGGDTTLGITVAAMVNREDFGMVWNVPMNDGGMMVGQDIGINLDIEADLVE
jgi:polyisoprenoid-binding protein YceI